MDNPTKYILSLKEKEEYDCNDFADTLTQKDKEIDWMKVYANYAELDTPLANFIKGYLHQYSKIGEKDIDKTVEHYERAIGQGDFLALNQLADLYYSIGEKDKSIPLWEAAADKGSTHAMNCLGNLYSRDNNETDAFIWYDKGIKLGSIKCLFNKSIIYWKREDYDNALPLLEYAVELRHPKAHLYLGELYSKGISVDFNQLKANKLFVTALNLGLQQGREMLEEMYRITDDGHFGADAVIHYENKLQSLFEENERLKQELKEKNTILYELSALPDAPAYFEAKKRFDEAASK